MIDRQIYRQARRAGYSRWEAFQISNQTWVMETANWDEQSYEDHIPEPLLKLEHRLEEFNDRLDELNQKRWRQIKSMLGFNASNPDE